MTDRIHALTVVLRSDMREEDAELIEQAISLIGGVVSVQKHVSDAMALHAAQNAKMDLRRKIADFLAL